MTAYYNEIDPFAADWLENLILVGAIAPGIVDRRSIEDVAPSDLKDFTQCHFFAGIGVWSHVLREAGWPDDRPVWTGSCPCQPFSSAGQGGGFEDERHLWPAFHHLVVICGPDVVFGEQVASPDGLAWLDLVHTDMEATNYAFGAFDLCAAGFGAPHIRQRLSWVAHANRIERHGRADGQERNADWETPGRIESDYLAEPNRPSRVVGVAHDARPQGHGGLIGLNDPARRQSTERHAGAANISGRLEHADLSRQHERPSSGQQSLRDERDERDERTALHVPGATNGFWGNADWLLCRNSDGEPSWRAVEPGSFPLVNGAPNRMGSLRGYGNAIVAPKMIELVKATIEYLDGRP